MRKCPTSLILLPLALTLVNSASAKCSLSAGDIIKWESAAQVFSQLEKVQRPEKDEFVTEEEFASQKLSKKMVSAPILVRGSFEKDYVKYDAETQQYYFGEWSWDGAAEDWLIMSRSVGVQGIFDNNIYGVGLSNIENPVGTPYSAQNSFGVTVKVSQVEKTMYGIFEGKRPFRKTHNYNESLYLEEWATEVKNTMKIRGTNTDVDIPSVRFSMELEKAKETRKSFKVGFEISPLNPAVGITKIKSDATLDDPVDTFVTYKTIHADILCAAVTDMGNKVLFTVLQQEQ